MLLRLPLPPRPRGCCSLLVLNRGKVLNRAGALRRWGFCVATTSVSTRVAVCTTSPATIGSRGSAGHHMPPPALCFLRRSCPCGSASFGPLPSPARSTPRVLCVQFGDLLPPLRHPARPLRLEAACVCALRSHRATARVAHECAAEQAGGGRHACCVIAAQGACRSYQPFPAPQHITSLMLRHPMLAGSRRRHGAVPSTQLSTSRSLGSSSPLTSLP